MTQRSMLAGQSPMVIVRAGGDVHVEGWDGERVQADTDSRWGLKLGWRSASEIARARAKVGDRVLFDIRLNVKNPLKKNVTEEAIEVQIGGSGKVYVPLGSRVKVYAGKNAGVQNIRGEVSASVGRDLRLKDVGVLVHAAAGRSMELECARLAEDDDFKFVAGRDLRFYIHDLTDAKLMIDDLGGYWETTFGDGRVKIRLKAGGDVTLVTDQAITGDLVGKIERPEAATGQSSKE
jgi:hypothetical protein